MLAWTLQHLALATLLAAVVYVACRIGRLGPVSRHALWVIVLVKLVTPPFIVVQTPWTWPAPIARMDSSLGGTPVVDRSPADSWSVADPAIAERAAGGAALGRAVSWESMALAIWIQGGVGIALVQIIRIARLRARVRRGVDAPPVLVEEVESLARQLGVRAPAARVVSGITSPLVWAVGRPMLLWPEAFQSPLPDGCRRGLLVHELAHLKRRDHWVGWIELAAGCLWWWNPLFWYVRAHVREEAELACDGWVINTLPDGRRAYAEALLAVCAGVPVNPTPMPALGVSPGSRRALERRLVMIMQIGRAHV